VLNRWVINGNTFFRNVTQGRNLSPIFLEIGDQTTSQFSENKEQSSAIPQFVLDFRYVASFRNYSSSGRKLNQGQILHFLTHVKIGGERAKCLGQFIKPNLWHTLGKAPLGRPSMRSESGSHTRTVVNYKTSRLWSGGLIIIYRSPSRHKSRNFISCFALILTGSTGIDLRGELTSLPVGSCHLIVCEMHISWSHRRSLSWPIYI